MTLAETDKSVGEKIAELLRQQTFTERLEMAAWFRDSAHDTLEGGETLDADWFAHAFDYWAGNELGENDA